MEHGDVQRYLDDVLGTSVRVLPWDGVGKLPFYLRDTYDFAQMELFGRHCVLLIASEPLNGELDVRRHLEMALKHAAEGALAIYATAALASYERRRLIAQGVPFIVPGNQLFLPPLGLDLREYFRSRPDASANALSPAAQALLFSALLGAWESEVHPGYLNQRFGYTPMTLSRASRELQAAGLAKAFAVGRERWLRFELGPRQVWQRAQPWLRSPRRAEHWAIETTLSTDEAPLAGLSALAQQSALAAPAHPVRAVSAQGWKQAQRGHLSPLHLPEPGATCWQIWRYEPSALAHHGMVDPLSLIVSLRDETDERVRQAVDELELSLPW